MTAGIRNKAPADFDGVLVDSGPAFGKRIKAPTPAHSQVRYGSEIAHVTDSVQKQDCGIFVVCRGCFHSFLQRYVIQLSQDGQLTPGGDLCFRSFD